MKKTAVITGATSGIGEAFARRLARDGWDLVITGRRAEIIRAHASELSSRHGVKVDTVIAELSEEKGVRKVSAAMKKCANLGMLVNNAGFGIDGPFVASDIDRETSMVRVHDIAAMELIHAALPIMIKNGGGSIISLSSIAGFLPLKRNASYSASKAFVTSFSESLHIEYRSQGIRFQALCPGFTHTEFHSRMKMSEEELKKLEVFQWMDPDSVVDCSLKYLKKGRVVCIPGFRNRLVVAISNAVPRSLYYSVVEKYGD